MAGAVFLADPAEEAPDRAGGDDEVGRVVRTSANDQRLQGDPPNVDVVHLHHRQDELGVAVVAEGWIPLDVGDFGFVVVRQFEVRVGGITASQRIARLTRTGHAAEASPAWSPDGNQIVFVSDQAGSPQLYVMNARNGQPKRITFEGSENVAPDWGPGGTIAFSSKRGGFFHVCVYDPRTGQTVQHTAGRADHEDPSWAPDGRHIVYARTENYRSSLYILDTLNDPEVRLLSVSGEWYSPAWSP